MFSLVPWKKRNGRDIAVRHERDWHPLARLEKEFEELWNRFHQGGSTTDLWDSARWGDFNFGWGNDLEERDKEYIFHAELPGFEPDEIDVQVSGNILTVSAEHREDTKKHGYRYGRYQRSFTLPAGAEADKIDARYHNGVLELHLPKDKEFLGRKIAVKSA